MKALGTFKEWDTKFQNRIKLATIVTSRIYEFNQNRWKEIQGQEKFVIGFLESYIKDFVNNQTGQVSFFNQSAGDSKKNDPKIDPGIPRHSDLESFRLMQDELYKSL